ncbi:MAG: hypothetical protein HYR96_12915 [Deltaproteobacteria bacterium]|nr:hypothetical protein [Deltaproteobacteria bacterium]
MEIDSQKPASVKRRDRAYLLKSLPSVDHLVKLVPDVDLPFEVKVRLARELLSQVRETLVGEGGGVDRGPLSHESLAHRLRESSHIGGFRRVVNATGIVLHTNLGRAPFGKEMLLNLAEVASDYLDLEFAEGTRGSRTRNSERGLCLLTGAEGAVVVNNNASALLLVLSTLSCDKEVIVSRGELVQIGGGFRIPDILASSQARLVEVGTTNITSSADYDRACGERTALILSVNRSNFTITGHTESPSLADLKLVADRHALTLCYDQGSGDISHIERSLKKRAWKTGPFLS